MTKRVLFLSRDRGSVQATLPVIRALKEHGGFDTVVVSLAMTRPLLDEHNIVNQPLDEAHLASAPDECLSGVLDRVKPDVVVSGSSPAKGPSPETPEQHAIVAARKVQVPTIGILDYWGMYEERFSRPGDGGGLSLVPDRLCVLDRRCFDDLSALGIPADRMEITHNPWMDGIVARARAIRAVAASARSGKALRVVFVSQPFAETAAVRNWSYTQLTLLERLVDSLPHLPAGESHRVTIWPHPAETRTRWSNVNVCPRPDIAITLSGDRTGRSFADVDLVVTGHSTLAYEAVYFGVPCISLRPRCAPDEKLLTEQLGLTHHLDSAEAFRTFLAGHSIDDLRRDLAARSDGLASERLFFSDGAATTRVMSAIIRTVEGSTRAS